MLTKNSMINSVPNSSHQAAAYLCEYSLQPFAECYCRNVTGRTVPNIAQYCMERFQECPIYRQHLTKITTGADYSEAIK